MAVSSYNQLGSVYLSTRKVTYNGGLIGQLINHAKFRLVSNNLHFEIDSTLQIDEYIKNYFLAKVLPYPIFNSSNSSDISYLSVYNNNIVTTSFAIIFIIIFFLTCAIPCFFWTIDSFNRYNPRWIQIKSKVMRHRYQPKIRTTTKHEIIIKNKKFISKVVIISSISWVLFISVFVSLIFCLMSGVILQRHFENSSDKESLVSSWKTISFYIDSFLTGIIHESPQIFNNQIDKMGMTIKSLLSSSLNSLTDHLLEIYGVKVLFTSTSLLVTSLNDTVNSMNVINNLAKPVITRTDQLAGKFEVYREMLSKSIESYCSKLVNKTECMVYHEQAQQLKINLVTANVNTESSTIMLFLMQQLHVNITDLNQKAINVEKSLYKDLQELTNKKVSDLHIERSLDDVRTLWNHIAIIFTPVQKTFNETSSSILIKIQDSFTPIFIVLLICLILLFILLFISIVLLFRYSLIFFLELLVIFQPTKSSSVPMDIYHENSMKSMHNPIRKIQHSDGIPLWTNNVLVALICCFLVFFIFASIVISAIGQFTHNEVCVQLNTSFGFSVIDKMLNSFIWKNWEIFLSFIQSRVDPVKLNLPKPNDILYKITVKCKNDSGLLKALRMTEIINISSFLWNAQNLNSLNSGLNETYNTLTTINVKSLIPSNLQMFLQTAKNVTEFFDNVDYKSSINELRKPLLQLLNVSDWIQESLTYFSSNAEIIKYLNSIYDNMNEINSISVRAHQISNAFESLQQRRNISQIINSLLEGFDIIHAKLAPSNLTYSIVAKLYEKIMLIDFKVTTEEKLSAILNDMMNLLFPCKDLPYAINCILDSMCSTNRFVVTLTGCGMNCAILSVMLLLFFQSFWFLVRIDLSKRTESNVSYS